MAKIDLSNISHSYTAGGLTASLAINNLFNQEYHYYEIDYSSLYVTPAEPTTINLQISYTF